MVEGVAKTAGLLDNLRAITTTIRKVAFRSSLSASRSGTCYFESWEYATPYQVASGEQQTFAKDTWGGEGHPDFARNWATSSSSKTEE